MKLSAFLSVFVFFGLVAAWSKEDYEIFGLQNDVATHEGANVTFYDLLEIRPNANQEQITKAYRKKSRTIHPDKVKRAFIANYAKDKSKAKSNQGVNVNKGPTKREIDAAVKDADARSARLNLVANVLRGPNRERYDHFLKNGFPLWKGTGYYYSRFRPGLGSVLAGLFLVFGGGAHYAALVLSWKRQREFVDRYIRQARKAAWGDEMGVRGVPGIDSVAAAPPPPAPESGEAGAVAVNRRQKRMMDKENKKDKKGGGTRVSARASSGTSTPTEQVASTGERKRVVAENGKTLIVDSIGNVFLEEQNGAGERQEFLLDIDQIERPTIRQTMVFRLPIWCFNKTVGRVLGTGTTEEEVNSDESEEPLVEEAETTATSNSRSRKRNKRSQRS
ncbi:Heat shock protein DnaJ [Penicillium cf. griseofulvum]|uniref:Heat shock protein DnaJ n=1 Tax=Penicillium cf. griseofulvum TaxID=2972120 RepID=A0A9W9M0I1_9EURO|nr:Heat shock protein DnaJ [Penicillium cf. griseofulvum]KAJ5430500.1 Heat shock protein DnaJ [Penicillium cf. griseofulvum]KAJ5435730.1 Heat shock protein DnaJ [Penicillium cf. griseofulvum]